MATPSTQWMADHNVKRKIKDSDIVRMDNPKSLLDSGVTGTAVIPDKIPTGGPQVSQPPPSPTTTDPRRSPTMIPGLDKEQSGAYSLDKYEQPTNSYTPPETTVAHQMEQLLSKDTPYLQQAEARGRSAAEAQGMSSSLQQTQAVEGERIRAALPIAQQDAAMFAKKWENTQHADLAKDFATHQFGLDRMLLDMNLASQERQAYQASLASLSSTMMGSTASIMNNSLITDKSTAIGNLNKQYKNLSTTMASLGGYDLTW